MRIIGKPEPQRLEIKRFYVTGLALSDDCPNCGKAVKIDLEEDYISYPSIGRPTPVHFYCPCDTEWERNVIVNLTLKEAE
jgi:hypothetical protein